MIFNSQPYYNEPGYEKNTNKTGAETYNKRIEQLTVQYAMTDWLTHRLKTPGVPAPSSGGGGGGGAANGKKPHVKPINPSDDAVWGDVIRKHFELKGRMMLETAQKWEKKQSDSQGMKYLVRDLRRQLKEHGFLNG